MEPTTAAIANPTTPEPAPKYSVISRGGIINSNKLTSIRIFRNGTMIFLNILNPFLKPSIVLSLSNRNETKLVETEKVIKIKALFIKIYLGLVAMLAFKLDVF